jgi:hypothetical protein
MTTKLELDAYKFWSLMQKMKGDPFPVIREHARSIELPTLAAATSHEKLADRIDRELLNSKGN